MGHSKGHKNKPKKTSAGTGTAPESSLENLEQAADALDDEEYEAALAQDFESVLAEVKKEVFEHQVASVSGYAEAAGSAEQGTEESKSEREGTGAGAVENGSQHRTSRNPAQRQLGRSREDLETVVRRLFDLGVLTTSQQVRAFKLQLLELLQRAGYTEAEQCELLPPLFFSHGLNVFRHRIGLLAAPVFHQKCGNLAERMLGDVERYKPWPVRRLAEISSIGAQIPVVSKELQTKGRLLTDLQLKGAITDARAQVKWEIAKFEAGIDQCTKDLVDLACGALIFDTPKELQVFSQKFGKIGDVTKEKLKFINIHNAREVSDQEVHDKYDGVPHIKLNLQLVGPLNTRWARHVCELQLHIRETYEKMQVAIQGPLGARLRRDMLFDPMLAQARAWQLFPFDPDAGIRLQSPINARPSDKTVEEVLRETESAFPDLIDHAPTEAGQASVRLPRKVACNKGVETLLLLGHRDTVRARAKEWEKSLVDLPVGSQIASCGGNHVEFLLQTLREVNATHSSEPRKVLEAARLLQIWQTT